MAKRKTNWLVIVLIIGVIGLLAMNSGLLPAFSVAGGQLTVQPQPQAPAVSTCEGSASLSLVYNIFDETAGNQTTSLNSDYNLVYYENGAYKGIAAAGTSLTFAPNATVTIYATDGATHDVYGFSDIVQLNCSSVTKAVPRGMQDSALTVVMYDMSTGIPVANTDAALTTLGAGETVTAQWYVKASTAQARYGTTEGGAKALFVADYNSLVYKQPVITSVEGGSFSLDVVPNGHISTAVTAGANSSVAYVITTNNLANLQSIKIDLRAEALTGTTNPDSNIGVSLYDSEMYQNNAGQWVVGFRNANTGADLGETNATDIFYVV